MAALSSSCRLLVPSSDAVPPSSLERTRLGSSSNVAFVQGRRGAVSERRRRGSTVRAGAGARTSRRDVVVAAAAGLAALWSASPTVAAEKEQDLQQKVMGDIESFQQRVGRTLEETREALASFAEEAIASLKFGGQKAADKAADAKSLVDGALPESKVAHS